MLLPVLTAVSHSHLSPSTQQLSSNTQQLSFQHTAGSCNPAPQLHRRSTQQSNLPQPLSLSIYLAACSALADAATTALLALTADLPVLAPCSQRQLPHHTPCTCCGSARARRCRCHHTPCTDCADDRARGGCRRHCTPCTCWLLRFCPCSLAADLKGPSSRQQRCSHSQRGRGRQRETVTRT